MIESVRNTDLPLPHSYQNQMKGEIPPEKYFSRGCQLILQIWVKHRIQCISPNTFSSSLCRGQKNKIRKGAGAMATVAQQSHRFVQAFVSSQGLIFIF